MNATQLIQWFESAKFKARHGDVVIVEDRLARKTGKDAQGVVAEGELTGHAHRVDKAMVLRVVDDLVQRTIVVPGEEARISHEEHADGVLPHGRLRSGIQEQYSPDGWARVED